MKKGRVGHAVRYILSGKGFLGMKLVISHGPFGARAPISAGLRPHVLPLVSGMWLLAAMISACSGDSQVGRPSVVAMTDTTPPYYQAGQTTIYEVQVPVQMPMRAPDSTEAGRLGPAPSYLASFGASTAPWIKVDDVQTTIRFTLTNLDDAKHSFELLIDPWNPYVKYKPGIQIVNADTTEPDLSGYDRFYILDKKQRLVGTIVPDDTRELAMDLATVMNISVLDPGDPDGNGLFNHTFNIQNRSNDPNDLLIAKYVPQSTDVPAMTGFDLGLRSSEPMNIAVEVTVDVQDIAGKKVMPADGTVNADNQPLPAAGATLAPPKVVPMP
jgi:hypothetical protein